MSEKLRDCPVSLKRSYASLADADAVLKIIRRYKFSGSHYPVAAYKCKHPGCHSWHLTSQKKRSRRRYT